MLTDTTHAALKEPPTQFESQACRTWSVAYAFKEVILRNMTTEGAIRTHIPKQYSAQRSEMKAVILAVMDVDTRAHIAGLHLRSRSAISVTLDNEVNTLADDLGKKVIAKAS